MCQSLLKRWVISGTCPKIRIHERRSKWYQIAVAAPNPFYLRNRWIQLFMYECPYRQRLVIVWHWLALTQFSSCDGNENDPGYLKTYYFYIDAYLIVLPFVLPCLEPSFALTESGSLALAIRFTSRIQGCSCFIALRLSSSNALNPNKILGPPL